MLEWCFTILKVNIAILYALEISQLGMQTMEFSTYVYQKCTRVFIAALSVFIQNWK
jgi:hypothetical protein